MVKAFVDCGAFRGKTIARFTAARPGFTVHAFECNPTLAAFNYGPGVNVIRKAIWTADGTMDFYLSKTHQDKVEGSTMYRDKITGNIDREHPVKVETIDFSKWLKDTFTTADYVVVKMNVEGAEYDVVPKLIEDVTVKLISELHIQWHYQKIDFPIEAHREIVSALIATGIKYFHGYANLYTGPTA